MNVDFTTEEALMSQEAQQWASSDMQLTGNSALSLAMSKYESSQAEGNGSLSTENAGHVIENDRLVMPKRPHNVIFLFIFSFSWVAP